MNATACCEKGRLHTSLKYASASGDSLSVKAPDSPAGTSKREEKVRGADTSTCADAGTGTAGAAEGGGAGAALGAGAGAGAVAALGESAAAALGEAAGAGLNTGLGAGALTLTDCRLAAMRSTSPNETGATVGLSVARTTSVLAGGPPTAAIGSNLLYCARASVAARSPSS